MFAEDSGLEILALGGEPGVKSARFSGENCSSKENIKLVLEKLKNSGDRRARFKTVIAFLYSNNVYTFEGIINGTISEDVRGVEGFGYDPIFIPEGFNKTFAEFNRTEKNLISHRGQAVKRFIEFLKRDPLLKE